MRKTLYDFYFILVFACECVPYNTSYSFHCGNKRVTTFTLQPPAQINYYVSFRDIRFFVVHKVNMFLCIKPIYEGSPWLKLYVLMK